MAARPGETAVAIVSSDTLVRTGAGKVFWLAASAGATGGAFQLNDSLTDNGTDKFSIVLPANSVTTMYYFDPPIKFANGIFVDVPGTNLIINVGWLP